MMQLVHGDHSVCFRLIRQIFPGELGFGLHAAAGCFSRPLENFSSILQA